MLFTKTIKEAIKDIKSIEGIDKEEIAPSGYIKIANACEKHYGAKIVQIFVSPRCEAFIVMRRNELV